MARRSSAERLLDIREAATDLRDIVADMGTDAFHALPHADRLAYRAVKNALAELGEAVKALPEDVRKRNPEVDWKGFAGLRDVVAHQYVFRCRHESAFADHPERTSWSVGGRGIRSPAPATISCAVGLRFMVTMATDGRCLWR